MSSVHITVRSLLADHKSILKLTLNFSLAAIIVLASVYLLFGVVAADGNIQKTITVSYNKTDSSFEVQYRFDAPTQVSRMEMTFTDLNKSHVTLIDQNGFNRASKTKLKWDGGWDSYITLRVDPKQIEHSTKYYVTSTSAFGPVPSSRVHYWYNGQNPDIRETVQFEGQGYASTRLAYAGDHSNFSRNSDGVRWNMIISDYSNMTNSPSSIVELYAQGENLTPAISKYNHVDIFVMPAPFNQADFSGQKSDTSIYLQDTSTRVDRIESVPGHEYFHVRLGSFRGEKIRWLTEASAEYYGELLSLNTKRGTFDEFLDAVRTTRYKNAKLIHQESGDKNLAEYEKGSHVLAALDAEIRRQTDGQRSLMDVLRHKNHDLQTYRGFKMAVVDVTNNKSMKEWVENYTTTSALPKVPDDPKSFTLSDRAVSDFATPTPTPTPVPTSTSISTPETTPTPTDGESAVSGPSFTRYDETENSGVLGLPPINLVTLFGLGVLLFWTGVAVFMFKYM